MLARRSSPIGCAFALLLCCAAAHASNRVVVNTTADDFGLDATHCSLREALYTLYMKLAFGGCAIVSGSLFDSVSLPAGTFVTTRAPVQGNAFSGGALFIGPNILVLGAGAGKTIIDGGNLDSVFRARPGAGKLAGVTDATIRNGLSDVNSGSGIQHENGQLLLQRVMVTQNRGGYAVESNNTEGVNLNQVTISNNGNTGFVAFTSADPMTVTIVNTTISGNVSAERTGGVEISANAGISVTANISNSTIAFNTGRADGQNYGTPGGLLVSGDAMTLYLRNSIVAENIRGTRYRDDCEAGGPLLVSQGYNIIENGFCAFQGDTVHDVTGIAPQLAPLWDYGSGVPTHAVFPGTLAYNTGNPATPGSGGAACENVDARGVSRGPNGKCDIGAYEYQADYVVTTLEDVGDPTIDDGICDGGIYLCSLRKAIQKANASSTFTTIQLPAGVIKLEKASSQGYNTDGAFNILTLNAVTLVGTGADATVIDGGAHDVTLRSGYLTTSTAVHGVTIRNGQFDAAGGGVRVDAGSFLLDHSRVTGNTALSGNGINVLPGAIAEIDASTIDHNRSYLDFQSQGGGILAQGTVRLFNSTVADNDVFDSGAGIYNLNGDVSMAFTTVAGNTQSVGSTGAGVAGSGGFWHVTNSIIAGNASVKGASLTESDCAAILLLSGYTFIQNANGCTIGGTVTYGVSGQDAQLAPLVSQGGATPTIGPRAGSPVIGLITNKSECVDLSGNQVLIDQRDIDRPEFSDWGSPYRCIIGAFQGTSDAIFADGYE